MIEHRRTRIWRRNVEERMVAELLHTQGLPPNSPDERDISRLNGALLQAGMRGCMTIA